MSADGTCGRHNLIESGLSRKKRRHDRSPEKRKAGTPRKDALTRIIGLAERRANLILVILLVIATARIVSTWFVYNHTSDEPAHIGCGMEWLDKGVYKLEPQHPPLARVAAALGPYLDGKRSQGRDWMYHEGIAILYAGGTYLRTLTLARLGVLPFFWLASVVVFLWCRKYFGKLAAVVAALLFTSLPPVVAHAGLATTDMALTCFLSGALFAFLLWAEKPGCARAALLGACSGLAIISKFSALPFLFCAVLVSLLVYLAMARPGVAGALHSLKALLPSLALAALVCFLVIWAGYRFSYGESPYFGGASLPSPALFEGIETVRDHNRAGHPSYLLGRTSESGFWFYYPVVLSVKTPLPVLVLLCIGVPLFLRRRGEQDGWRYWSCLAFIAGILGFALSSRINIGVRHVLPLYVLFALIAGVAAANLLRQAQAKPWAPWIVLALLVWHTGSSALSHPDYLPYVNEMAGSKPEDWVVDSDLDWGQDMNRLADKLQEVGATQVAFDPFVLGHWQLHGMPPMVSFDVEKPVPGWNAVSLTHLKLVRMGIIKEQWDIPIWPDYVPPDYRIGKGIFLWHFPAVPRPKPRR